ncbi:SRPBCC family protein [Micromonospora sp. RL09-050-HVF-A]|uniref:SRPBCC family protein n=1 Tax=Micromonospora sp. RL09-050-HVF-A TaxID=1703433 RepID=UPI001C5F4EBA|nr:SRPBCC family protein [Micromonospora sp. RL09-050-HVF-A]MBW4703790.1 SRPBCC family protein [Micromonospora sp. RL09-050-HVF-A]
MENGQVTGAANEGLRIDETAPVISRHRVTVQASAEIVWRVLTDIDAWTTWLPELPYARAETPGPLGSGSVFRWSASGLDIVSTIAEVRPYERLVWSGHANGPDGILGVHVWNLAPGDRGLIVSTEESFAGPPVDADPGPIQAALDESLVTWLQRLKDTAEADAAG